MNNRSKTSTGYLAVINHYLLINQPMLWACKFSFLIFFGGGLILVNTLTAFFMPISDVNIPNMYIIVAYLSGSSLLLFLMWLILQNLFTFRIVNGIISPMYLLKVFIITYSILGIINFAQIRVFGIISGRIKNAITYANLPKLNSQQYKAQISFIADKLNKSDNKAFDNNEKVEKQLNFRS